MNKIFTQHDYTWVTHFECLKNFLEVFQQFPSVNSPDPQEATLAKWTRTQRTKYKQNNLEQYRIDKLESIPQWYWNREQKWDNQFNNFKTFIQENDRYPIKQIESEAILANWLNTQIVKYRSNKLSENKKIKLESIKDFKQKAKIKRKILSWNQRFQQLKLFYKQNNRYPKYNPKEKTLFNWIKHQKNQFNKKALSNQKIQLLESLPNWKWTTKRNPTTKKQLKTLQEIKKFYENHNRYPNYNKPMERKLSIYIHKQKVKYYYKELDEEKVEFFNSLQDWNWNINEISEQIQPTEKWNASYNEFKETIANNQFPIPGSTLYIWQENQKYYKRKGILSLEREKKLSETEGWFWNKDEIWLYIYQKLDIFMIEKRRYPKEYSTNEDERTLAQWIKIQKRKIKNKSINQNKLVLLKRLPLNILKEEQLIN